MIDEVYDALYINFNYTAVLETVYKISEEKIIHIHGSLRERYGEPVLGHGNITRIEKIQEKREVAERLFDEKKISICNAVKDYYLRTYKDIHKYMHRLLLLTEKEVDEIITIGHSLAGVDIPYFRNIDMFTSRKANWKVYYYKDCERERMNGNLISCGIDMSRIDMVQSDEFYDL